MADSELQKKLQRRVDRIESAETDDINGNEPKSPPPVQGVFNPYTEFKEMSRTQIKDLEKMFKKYDEDGNHFLDLTEMKHMMEKLGAPQTHLGLKSMIAEVDEDKDGVVSFREFLLIFRKAQAGELAEGSGLFSLAQLAEVDVSEVGVSGAKGFFESKIDQQTFSNKFEAEIKKEQEDKRQAAEEAKVRKQQFKDKMANFNNQNN